MTEWAVAAGKGAPGADGMTVLPLAYTSTAVARYFEVFVTRTCTHAASVHVIEACICMHGRKCLQWSLTVGEIRAEEDCHGSFHNF